MKNSVIFFLLLFSTAAAAQELKPFKFGLGVGYLGGNFSPGGLIYFEPSYRIGPVIAVGSRMEFAIGDLNGNGAIMMNTHSIYSQYYFATGPFRPYAGMGAGLFYAQTVPTMCDCSQELKKPVPGFYPKLGFDIGHFNFAIEYNILKSIRMTSSSILPIEAPAPPRTDYIKASYLSTKIGFSIGGGRRKQPVLNRAH